jgi:quercetin dioxygenase-like cupin family protein
MMPSIPRRIITGHKNGVSTIIQDGSPENIMKNESGYIISDIWATDSMPANLEQCAKIENSLFPTVEPKGSLFRYVHIPPDSQIKIDLNEIPANARHPYMHKTETLDYIIILSGEVYLIMEEGETLLKPGDIVVQCGTNHAWNNRSSEPCIQLAVLLDAKQSL